MPILATKLFHPPPRPKIVFRQRLIDRLNEGLCCRLTLISAPAGFGKTTLAASWIAGRRRPVAWLSLDEGDSDLSRFLTYFIAALQGILNPANGQVGETALTALQSAQPPAVEAIVTLLLNEIAAVSQHFILILDDYHLIDEPAVDQALGFLLEHLPPNMHLVIASREDPLLPLSRLRVQGHLTELRAGDLRFTSGEAAQFLNEVMGLDLSAEEIHALDQRTEGWIAGLQLAVITMQGRKDKAALIDSFSGSHRFVLDYLIEEVLEQQPQHLQDFLLQTAILSKLNGSLCDALTGQENGQATLEKLEKANLFIVPLDDDRQWYRYHHLFGELLRRRLRQSGWPIISALYLKASSWYEQQGTSAEAIEYALRGQGFQRAGDLIAHYVDDIWQLGEPIQLQKWLAKLPDAVISADPFLCMLQASNLYIGGRVDEAEYYLKLAEDNLDDPERLANSRPPFTPDPNRLRGRAAVIRAHILSYRGLEQDSIDWAERALDYLPPDDATWRWSAFDCLGTVYSGMDEGLAHRNRLEALQASKTAGNAYMILLASLRLVVTLRDLGRLEQAAGICRQQLQMAQENGLAKSALAGWLYTLWGEILAEQNDLDRALELANEGDALAEQGSDLILKGSSYLCLLRVLFSRGEFDEASELIHKINFSRHYDLSPWIETQANAWQARIWLAEGRLEEAAQWSQGLNLELDGQLQQMHDFDYVVQARLLTAQENFNQAHELLGHLLQAAAAGGRISKMIELHLLQALNFQAQGRIDQALSALRPGLDPAEAGGFVRIFLDEGDPACQLLQEALARGMAPAYLQQLSAAFPQDGNPPTAPGVDQSHLIEPLSDRELEVLQCIAKGLSNQEIATRLYLSLNTVKVHTRNIYGKLDVHSRTQAVIKARSLDLLPPV